MDQVDITFPCDDGFEMPAVLTLPEKPRPSRPALLLIYEVLGLNNEMKRVARELADAGYVVLIPDLFARGPRVLCIVKAIRAVMKQKGQPIEDLDAARRYLSSRKDVNPERLGIVGFCMGGGFAIVLAMRGHYKAIAPFYGDVPDQLPAGCATVASFGARDKRLLPAAEKLEKHLTRLGIEHDIKVYEGAGHSFYTYPEGFFAEKIGPLLPLNVGYHEPSALDAKERVMEFFDKHLA